MPFIVEQVGYDPTPSDFQSAAMTTSATTPLFSNNNNFNYTLNQMI